MITIHQCECTICQQSKSHPDQVLHRQMNLLMSRLDEQQRRWYAAIEAQKSGHGGAALLAKVTPMHSPRQSKLCFMWRVSIRQMGSFRLA